MFGIVAAGAKLFDDAGGVAGELDVLGEVGFAEATGAKNITDFVASAEGFVLEFFLAFLEEVLKFWVGLLLNNFLNEG